MLIIQFTLIAALAAVFIKIILSDLRSRKISNWQNLAVLVLILLGSFIFDYDLQFKYASIFLTIGLGLFYANIIGGGDVKLIFSLMLALKEGQIFTFFIFVSFVGALLAVFALVMSAVKKDKSYIENGVAYGVAIVLGFLLSFINLLPLC